MLRLYTAPIRAFSTTTLALPFFAAVFDMASPSLLSDVRAKLTIDVDSMDPAVAERHAAVAKFSDMTSNQAIVHNEAVRPERADLFKLVCSQIRSSEAQLDIETGGLTRTSPTWAIGTDVAMHAESRKYGTYFVK